MRILETPRTYRPTLLGFWLLATLASAVLSLLDGSAFSPFFGPVNAVFGTGVVVGIGVISLTVLERRDWFQIHGRSRGWLVAPVLAAIPFLFPVVAVDWFGGFPSDINVGAPESLLFYPTMALVAESVFHLAPLALLSLVLSPAHRGLREGPPRYGIVATALIEPTLQVFWASGQSPWWANAYVAVHVLVINLLGLYFFRRFGFFSAYVFRVSYYVVWHILWGFFRLELLFGG